jgi:hypothetical protein
MPAVQLSQLKAQIEELCQRLTLPDEFSKHLRDLFESYAHWAYRAGEKVQSGSGILSYNIPPLVIHHLKSEVVRRCQERPAAALLLIDVLWRDKYLETRCLAATILGQLDIISSAEPDEPPGEPIVRRISSWAKPNDPKQIQEALFNNGSVRLRQELPDRWLDLLSSWLKAEDNPTILMGLHALLTIIQDKEYENIPSSFRLLTPLVSQPSTAIQKGLLNVFEVLADIAPAETTYFLRQQVLKAPLNDDRLRFIRRCLPLLPETSQTSVRDLIKINLI